MESYLGWKIDFETPQGAPALAAPDSISWRVFKNPIALGIGGIAAVLMEFAEPRIRSGVWDHSTFKQDPIGRSRRTGMAAMVGVYGPEAAARRVIQGVTNMHQRVEGQTPSGESYRALDGDLLDWVSATATYGFVTAYDRFVATLTEAQRTQFFQEGVVIARLYGAPNPIQSETDFNALMQRLAPRFEPHDIVHEFLGIIESGKGLAGVPQFLRRAVARAAVSILPPRVRESLALSDRYNLTTLDAAMLRFAGAAAERAYIPASPAAQACRRLGLPGNFLYRSAAAQQRLLAARAPAAATVAAE